MKNNLYENLNYPDLSFPVIYHIDVRDKAHGAFDFKVHWHDSIELLYFTEGTADVKCDDKTVQAKAGDLVIVNTNEMHTVTLTSDRCLYHCFIISQDLFDNKDLNIYTSTFNNLISQDFVLSDLFDSAIKEFSLKKERSNLAVKGFLFGIFSHLLRYCQINESYMSRQRKKILGIVKDSLQYMENNFHRNISLDDICQKEGLSKYYFCRIFKETIGRSPIEYLNSLRINNAAELLKSGKYNVSEAAEMCGFNNINYFSKVFKKYKNALPSSMKKL